MFKYSLDNKRYYTLNYYNKMKYNSKVFKISLNTGFGCPNKKNGKGCIYCYNGSGHYKGIDLLTQFEIVKNIMEKKWPNSKYIGYFQADTNTYAPVSILKEKYESILNLENVIGLNIATRCDALPNDVLDYLEELNKKTNLVIELGLQTIHEKTSTLINRGHTLKQFEDAVKNLRKRNIDIVVHIINGLPYETKEMMIETAKFLNTLDIQGIKIHMLYILKNTKLEKLYLKEKFKLLTQDEYISIVCEQLQNLRPEIVIHRLTGDPDVKDLVEPKWVVKKINVLNGIDKYMNEKNIFQGDFVK